MSLALRPFEEDFKLLKTSLQEMGSLVAHSVHKAVRALVEQNQDYAHQVMRDEARIEPDGDPDRRLRRPA